MFLTAALLLLALATAAAGLAVLGGRVSASLDVASHFAPIIGAANALLALTAGLAGRPAAAGLALVGLAGVLAAMAPELAARLRPRSRRGGAGGAAGDLTLVQFNIWNCNVDLDGTVAWLSGVRADVAVLQEVSDGSLEVAQRLLATYPHQAPGETPGTRLLSRWPLLAAGPVDIRRFRNLTTGVWARIDHPSGAFDLIGFHAAWPIPPGEQQAHSTKLAARAAQFERDSLIVCGDFNSTPWSGALQRQDRLLGLERRTRALFTWPVQPYTRLRLTSPVPLLPLDHVYAGPAWRTVSVRTGPRLGSDHLPVVAALARAPERQVVSEG